MKKLNVLVACESSGVVRGAFRKLGHNAWSCDLLPCDADPRYHVQDDVLRLLNQQKVKGFDSRGMEAYGRFLWKWDLMIAHPPCTYLCNSGVRWLWRPATVGSWGWNKSVPERWDKMRAAAEFFLEMWGANVPYIAVENPIMHSHAKKRGIAKQTQIIQPYMFGHLETKATCLWLKGLPNLTPTVDVEEAKRQMMLRPKAERNRIHQMPPGKNRWKERSKTFEGIANAMAAQWSAHILAEKKER